MRRSPLSNRKRKHGTHAGRGFVRPPPTLRPFPAAVKDVKCTVRWLRANAGVFNIDSDRIAALGYSSGGNRACLLGVTEFERRGTRSCAELRQGGRG
jgi:hypothetical protein